MSCAAGVVAAMAVAAGPFAWLFWPSAPSWPSASVKLPVVDVSQWVSELSADATAASQASHHDAVVRQLDHAFSEYGFAVVVGHGVQAATFDRVYNAAKAFFHSGAPHKRQYDLNLGYGYGGYLAAGNEAGGQLAGDANPERKGDLVESLTCRGLSHLPTRDSARVLNESSTMLPESSPHFAQDMSDTPWADRVPPDLLEPIIALHNALLPFKALLTRTTERVMGVEEGAFRDTFDPRRGGIRFPFYPELPTFSASEKTVGYGAHADSGGMVLLRIDRDNPVGTEVWYQDRWLPIPTDIPNAIVLNGGTVLQRLTGGRWKAAKHRAIRANRHERLSIVYGAMVPRNDLEVSSLAVADLGKTSDRKTVVRVKEYLDARVRMQRPEMNPRDRELIAYVDE